MIWRGKWDPLFRKKACCQPEVPLSEHLPFIHSRAEHSRESTLDRLSQSEQRYSAALCAELRYLAAFMALHHLGFVQPWSVLKISWHCGPAA